MEICTRCRNLQPVPGPSAGFIGSGTGPDLVLSAESCRYCSIILEGLRAYCPSIERVASFLLIKPPEAKELLEMHYRLEPDTIARGRRGLHFYVTSSNDPMADLFGVSQDLELDTGSTHSLTRMKSWLDNCESNHVDCRMNNKFDFLPTRVLDLQSCSDQVVLHDTGPGDVGLSYTALSHCWGKGKPPKLLTSNISDLHSGLLTESLPKTFRDAVYVTRELGCRFLWIDSLCIIQDSKEDWEKEASCFADIYRSSFVTLSAMASSDSAGGLFYRKTAEAAKHTIHRQFDDFPAKVEVHARLWLDHSPLFDSDAMSVGPAGGFPLLARSWCFQEYILASRVLSFTEHEILWECPGRSACHCGQYRNNNRSDIPSDTLKAEVRRQATSTDPAVVLRLWRKMIEAFSAKDITYDSDKLPALSGVARILEKRVLGKYMMGMWEHNLSGQLLWQVNWNKSHDRHVTVRRCTDASAPSWSWISVDGPIFHPTGVFQMKGMDVVGLEEKGRPSSSRDGNGDLASIPATALVVRGVLLRAAAWFQKASSAKGSLPRYLFHPHEKGGTGWTVDAPEDCIATEQEPMQVFMLVGAHHGGLVLVPVSGQEPTYRRIGVFNRYSPYWNGNEHRTVEEYCKLHDDLVPSVVRLV